MRIPLCLVLVCCSLAALGQHRSIALHRGQRLVVRESMNIDSLYMADSSALVLQPTGGEITLHIRAMRVEHGCQIVGAGTHGKPGRSGYAGTTVIGPCYNGTNGTSGVKGTDGGNGVNLILYLTTLRINGNLTIDLTGGDGGKGGDGGHGGGGSSGTRICNGGNGGNGGNGAVGGNGGNAGNLTIYSKESYALRSWTGHLIRPRLYGGRPGLGGLAGAGGAAGLGPAGQDGRQGARGRAGAMGTAGEEGGISFKE